MSETLRATATVLEQSQEEVNQLFRQHPDFQDNPDLLITPEMAQNAAPFSAEAEITTELARKYAADIVKGEDGRLLIIVGPCSIHDPEAALEYAFFVDQMRNQYGEDLEIIMRAYYEKPRTTDGWKGLIYDPYLDGTDNQNVGLVAARILGDRIARQGVPLAMERLDPMTMPYLDDMAAWNAVGARNTLDQNTRLRMGGSAAPTGFKNSIEGSVQGAVDGIIAASKPNSYPGIDMQGRPKRIRTIGNPNGHVILRGDERGPNYSPADVAQAAEVMQAAKLRPAIMVDASHGNSRKDHRRQMEVVNGVAEQVSLGQHALMGVMIESHLIEGKQKHDPKALENLEYGQSITDACVGLETTSDMLGRLASAVSQRRNRGRIVIS